MSQWLRAWAAFLEDLGLFPVSVWQLMTVTPVPDPVSSSGLGGHQTQSHIRQSMHSPKINEKNFKCPLIITAFFQ